MYHVILAGGSGTRFWPLSTESNPKQFLKVVDDLSLIKATYNRLLNLAPKEKIFIVSSEKYLNKINDEINQPNIIIEPSPKNTAPAILASALIKDIPINQPTPTSGLENITWPTKPS